MTRKRYIKLAYALMQKIHQAGGCKAEGWGTVLKGVSRVKYGTKQFPKTQSYAEAWESIKSIRVQYGM